MGAEQFEVPLSLALEFAWSGAALAAYVRGIALRLPRGRGRMGGLRAQPGDHHYEE